MHRDQFGGKEKGLGLSTMSPEEKEKKFGAIGKK